MVEREPVSEAEESSQRAQASAGAEDWNDVMIKIGRVKVRFHWDQVASTVLGVLIVEGLLALLRGKKSRTYERVTDKDIID